MPRIPLEMASRRGYRRHRALNGLLLAAAFVAMVPCRDAFEMSQPTRQYDASTRFAWGMSNPKALSPIAATGNSNPCRLFRDGDTRLRMIPSYKSNIGGLGSNTAKSVATDSMFMSSVTRDAPPSNTATPAQTMNDALFQFNKQLIDTVYNVICTIYPVTGTTRDYCRFFVLETVARVPYFAYLSVLHLRETLGQRTIGQDEMRARMRTHYAEADNELHHLLIMEELGRTSVKNPTAADRSRSTNDRAIQWMDRAVAHTMAFGYFWYVVMVYTANEPAAYHLSELIEHHAYETYDSYLTNYESQLQALPVPDIARQYYVEENPMWLDLYCTVPSETRAVSLDHVEPKRHRIQLNSLYDVFVQIRNDEGEHWKTLCNLVQYDNMQAVTEEYVQSTQPSTHSSS